MGRGVRSSGCDDCVWFELFFVCVYWEIVKVLYALAATSLERLRSLGMVSTSCFVSVLFTDLF